MEKFFFTYGANHVTKEGVSLGQYYTVIEAPNEGVAREVMYNARKDKWAFSYHENLFGDQAEKYKLHKIALQDVRL